MNTSLFQRIPKIDLHCHLDGSLRLSTLVELATEQGVSLPATTAEALRPLVCVGPDCTSLLEYLKAFKITGAVLHTAEALRRVAYELLEDCAQENIRYLEVRYAPFFHLGRGLSPAQTVEAVLLGLYEGARDFGIQSGLILCAIRSLPADCSLEVARLCVAFRERGVVGFDLAGKEAEYPPLLHQEAFVFAKQHNLSYTIHAGEGAGATSLQEALQLGAQRIGQGVRIQEDPSVLAFLRDHQIPIEMCPSSNAQTKAVSSLEEHPLLHYLRQGLKVTVNTDNRLITDTTLSQELALCYQVLGASFEELQQLALNSVDSAFVPLATKQGLRQEFIRAYKTLLPA